VSVSVGNYDDAIGICKSPYASLNAERPSLLLI